MKLSLEERQCEMRDRYSKRSRRGPKLGTKWKRGQRITNPAELVKARLVAVFLLRRGWRPAQVAKQLKLKPEVITKWIKDGCPILRSRAWEKNGHSNISKLKRLRDSRHV